MIAQLSPSVPWGSPSASSIGVRWAGYFSRYSGSVVLPQTSTSSKSSPAARTKIRAVRLFTLGLKMFSVYSAIRCSPLSLQRAPLAVGLLRRAVVRQRPPRAPDERLDRIREVLLGDVVVAALHADLVRLEQHVGVRVAERRLEAVRRQLDQQPQRVLEVDGVHEAAILDPAVADPALVQALHRLMEAGLRELEHEGHAEQALPEVDRGLPVRPDERDVMDALALQFSHRGGDAMRRPPTRQGRGAPGPTRTRARRPARDRAARASRAAGRRGS